MKDPTKFEKYIKEIEYAIKISKKRFDTKDYDLVLREMRSIIEISIKIQNELSS